MQIAMLKYDSRMQAEVQIFTEFGIASCKAQEFEALLKVNLQYSLALAGEFADLTVSDESSRRNDRLSLGPIITALEPHLDDEKLRTMVEHALETRNSLMHYFFRKRVGVGTPREEVVAEAVTWCRAATLEFTRVCRKLESRWQELAAMVARDPDAAVPGMLERMQAAERGEWPQ